MKRIILFVIVLLSISTYSQKKIDVYIKSVNEYRFSNSMDNYIQIYCSTNDIEIDPKNLVKTNEISFAEDNLGNNLNKPVKSNRNKYSSYGFYIYLSGTTRDAKSIKKVNGTLLQTSTGKESATIHINKFRFNIKPGENLVKEKTKKAEVVLLTKQIFKDLKALEPETLNRFVENKIIDAPNRVSVQDFFSRLGYNEEYIMKSFSYSGYSLYLNDPEKEIISVEAIDEKGHKSGYGYISSISKQKLSYIRKSTNTFYDSDLVIKIADKKNTKEYKFELENIMLP